MEQMLADRSLRLLRISRELLGSSPNCGAHSTPPLSQNRIAHGCHAQHIVLPITAMTCGLA